MQGVLSGIIGDWRRLPMAVPLVFERIDDDGRSDADRRAEAARTPPTIATADVPVHILAHLGFSPGKLDRGTSGLRIEPATSSPSRLPVTVAKPGGLRAVMEGTRMELRASPFGIHDNHRLARDSGLVTVARRRERGVSGAESISSGRLLRRAARRAGVRLEPLRRA